MMIRVYINHLLNRLYIEINSKDIVSSKNIIGIDFNKK